VFDKNEFVESVIKRGRSLDQIVKEAREKIHQIESRPIRAAGSSDHVHFLGSVEFFLHSRKIPAVLSADNFQLLYHLAQHLVDRSDLEPDILELFGE